MWVGALASGLLLNQGCASLTGTVVAASGQWPTTSSREDVTWLEGEPTTALVVEARLESPPRALCEARRFEPAAHVVHDDWGFDTGGRLAYGFIGLSELGLAAAMAFVPRADGEPSAGLDVAATVVGLDGLATVLLAFLIPDRHYRWEEQRAARAEVRAECPADVAFEAAGQAFPVGPDGRMGALDARSLMLAVVETGAPVALRFRGEVRTTAVPPETRCAWALELGSAFAPAVCPPPPPFARAPRP